MSRDQAAAADSSATESTTANSLPTNSTANNSTANNIAASAAEQTPQPDTAEPAAGLPQFVRSRGDKLLFAGFMLVSLFYLALLPFKAKLLVEAPLLNVFLTGGSFSTLALGAHNSDNLPFLAFVAITAALSAIKFLPLYYVIGKRWGDDFVTFMFHQHKPLWFRWLENFIFRRPLLSLGLCFIPFFPANPSIVTVVAGIKRVSPLPLIIAACCYSLLLKIMYITLGIVYGTAVIATLQLIDKYMLWATLALVVWMMIVSTRKELRAGAAEKRAASAAEKLNTKTSQTN